MLTWQIDGIIPGSGCTFCYQCLVTGWAARGKTWKTDKQTCLRNAKAAAQTEHVKVPLYPPLIYHTHTHTQSLICRSSLCAARTESFDLIPLCSIMSGRPLIFLLQLHNPAVQYFMLLHCPLPNPPRADIRGCWKWQWCTLQHVRTFLHIVSVYFGMNLILEASIN